MKHMIQKAIDAKMMMRPGVIIIYTEKSCGTLVDIQTLKKK